MPTDKEEASSDDAATIPSPDGDGLSKDEQSPENLNLCDYCRFHFATCEGEPVFGHDFGNDNVIDCDQYERDN